MQARMGHPKNLANSRSFAAVRSDGDQVGMTSGSAAGVAAWNENFRG
jgi:hypothetical protein